MAIFASTCAPYAVNDGITTTLTPEPQGAIVGQTFLSRQLRLSRTVANGRWLRRGLQRPNKKNHGAECFRQHGALFWFGHVHLIPTSFTLGNVLTGVEETYELFNAYRRQSKTISATTKTATDGFTFTNEPADSPNALSPLTGVVVTVNISPTGPVTINASVQYDFVGGESLTVTFTGTRVVVASLEPQENITERWEWYTDVIEAASGNEVRISARDVPRQTYIYRYKNEDADLQFFENQLWGWLENTWGLPLWTDYTVLTADIAAGATNIPVESTADRDFRSNVNGGEIALVWSDKGTFEAFEVSSFTSTALVARQGLNNAFSEGDIVMPMRLARITDTIGGSYFNVNVKERAVPFRVINNQEQTTTSPAPLFDAGTYRGLPIWDITSDYLVTSGSYNVNDDKGITVFDDKLGKIAASTNRKYPKNTLTGLSMEAYGRAEFVRIRAFLHAMRGRQKSFWVSTGRKDFVVESEVTAPATEINVEPINYTNQVFNVENGPKTRQDIEIVYVDGTVDRRRITGAQITEGIREVLTLDSSVSQTVSTDNVERISFLVKRRLASDTLNFEHESYEGEVTVPVGLVDVFDE